jgi:16S rRNA (guanine527-N7)-methyltransferase
MTIDPKRQKLIDTFLHYNSILNLSAIRDAEWVYQKHILDSLELLNVKAFTDYIWQQKQQIAMADIGTGWGFPLLPLAMSLPDVHFTWIDSVRKKLQAINDMCDELKINNVEFLRERIEQITTSYDVITARAVAHIEKLLPRVEKMLKPGSKLILYKKAEINEYGVTPEREIMMKLLAKYKLKLIKEHYYSLFDGDIQRVITILEKWT